MVVINLEIIELYYLKDELSNENLKRN